MPLDYTTLSVVTQIFEYDYTDYNTGL